MSRVLSMSDAELKDEYHARLAEKSRGDFTVQPELFPARGRKVKTQKSQPTASAMRNEPDEGRCPICRTPFAKGDTECRRSGCSR
jgi:hypothetical protein